MKYLEPLRRVNAGVLDVAYFESGPADGIPVFLIHGFPYDIHAYTEVAPLLAARGCRVIVPYLRGFGPTRFLSDGTPRSGEQAALGADLLALMDALAVPRAVLAGYDWGGRAACVVAALWPGRCSGCCSCSMTPGRHSVRATARPPRRRRGRPSHSRPARHAEPPVRPSTRAGRHRVLPARPNAAWRRSGSASARNRAGRAR